MESLFIGPNIRGLCKLQNNALKRKVGILSSAIILIYAFNIKQVQYKYLEMKGCAIELRQLSERIYKWNALIFILLTV